MDMKKLLQVVEGASTNRPAGESSDIKRSLEIITESANPHKVSLPVQMAMQHYQKPVEKKVAKSNGLLQQYFENVEAEHQAALNEKREALRMYSQKIANRVLVKEAAMPAQMPVAAATQAPVAAPEVPAELPAEMPADEIDTVTLDIPLMIRLLEYAREDAQTDMDLHNVAEQLITLSKEIGTLTMDHYDSIVGGQEEPAAQMDPSAAPNIPVAEACWKNYKQIGMKKKGNKSVPNCVPKK